VWLPGVVSVVGLPGIVEVEDRQRVAGATIMINVSSRTNNRAGLSRYSHLLQPQKWHFIT